jgi:TPR repeat protein
MTQRKRLQIGAAVTLATIMALLSFAPVTAGPLEDAVAAYVKGDNETAVRLLRPLAEQGDARAQYHLGTRYFTGSGEPQDYAEALKWFRLSADQGNPDGQGALGSMYYMGRGVPQDYVLAHMWFNLSAARGGSPARRDSKLHQMTPEQIAEAQRLAREWKPTTQPPR